MCPLHAQMVMLGSGSAKYEAAMRAAEAAHRPAFRGWVGFSVPVAHRIMAACDVLLMPSRFEPCGLNQLFAMRYGTVPIAHATGGLRDTIRSYDPHAAGARLSGQGAYASATSYSCGCRRWCGGARCRIQKCAQSRLHKLNCHQCRGLLLSRTWQSAQDVLTALYNAAGCRSHSAVQPVAELSVNKRLCRQVRLQCCGPIEQQLQMKTTQPPKLCRKHAS